MPLQILNFDNYLKTSKNLYKIIFLFVAFLCIVKLPSLFTSDIQPWDEGMYATRVLSIHANGDFIDQTSHSVGAFYSGSHPPLLIWIGYLSTSLLGINSTALKIIPFIFSLLCVIIIILFCRKFFDASTGIFASMMFTSNIIFDVFSRRFQFDYPYTFLILLSVYLFFLFNERRETKYLYLSGITFGLCLMIKILVGFYIPIIILASYIFVKDKVNFKFKDIVTLTTIGVLICLPWHIYMLVKYGSDFTDYFLKFHIYERALHGVEMNEKESGIFYHFSYLLTIIPYSALVFVALLKDFSERKILSWQKIFLWVWFITGFAIITLFRTKLEVYILMVMTPCCILLVLFIRELDKQNLFFKTLTVFMVVINILWFATESQRPSIKLFVLHSNKLFFIAGLIASLAILAYLSRYLAGRFELQKVFYLFIFFFFISINIYYLFNTPVWENKFRIEEIRDHIEMSGKKKIMYVATNFRHNPQFSFYFRGLDLNWENPQYEYKFIDNKNGVENTKKVLESLNKGEYEILVEKDYINRAVYDDSKLFIPENARLVMKRGGYELYEN
ncbi:MAG: glycosyltransferase family 39 protein [bacterium]